MCNTQFPEGGCLPSEVYGLQDINAIDYDYNALLDGDNVSRLINNPSLQDVNAIDYDYNALLDGDNVSRLINNPSLQDVNAIDYDYNALLDGDNVSRLINNPSLQDVDIHYVNPLWNHNFSISQSSRGHR
ncbi:uncharacterized protein ACHE_10951A [Aspergillus chevalieri]|uniref:Uncharacterized protein n=1 Tax=Aspergillus chevalieri TaxID=182096 RepID=A0A7R7VF74_ASPCH|nr:uncharacterized protein ACHE_10951A [Aspergillus chevalieri]BCR83549.1 hypothetical protein ACHE_10951A [Aspergillus chevalieri]